MCSAAARMDPVSTKADSSAALPGPNLVPFVKSMRRLSCGAGISSLNQAEDISANLSDGLFAVHLMNVLRDRQRLQLIIQ